MITPKQQAKIDEIMDEFDFKRVHKIMDLLKWEWFDLKGVPSPGDIRRRARVVLQEMALKKPGNQKSWEFNYFSGGLKARRFGAIDSFGPWENFSLEFVAEHWGTEEEENNSTILNTLN